MATFLHNHAADIWACEFLQVTDLFFRPLAGVLPHRTQDTTGHPCRCDKVSNRSLGRAYRCEKLPRMGKHRNI